MLDLHECCSLLCSSKSTERQEGESLLLRTLTAYRHEMIAQYTASDWTQLVEALLESIELERAALIGKERTAAGNARLETRMTRLARDLCTVIDLCYTQITPRLARILWESAIGVLPLRENELCEPLLLEYARVLKCILRQPQYRSRLVSPAWEQLVDICRCGLNRTSQPVTRHQGQSSEQGAIESELAQLFCVLLSVETIPLTKHTTALLDILLNYFKEREIETSGRAYMLAATNHLLYEIGMGALEELQQFTRAVFPYISTGWDTKDLTVRRLTLQFMQCHFIDLHGFAMDNAINEQYCIDDNGDDNDEDSINSKECENAPTDQLVRKTLQSISLQLYAQQLSYYDYLVSELAAMRLCTPLRMEHIHFYSGSIVNPSSSSSSSSSSKDGLCLFTQPMMTASSLLLEDKVLVSSWTSLTLAARIFLIVGTQQHLEGFSDTKLSSRSRRPTKKSRTTDFTSLFLTELSRPCSFTTEIHAQTYHQLLFFMLQDTRLACRYFKDEHYLTLVQHLFDCVETARPELQGWAIACIAALIRLASRERIPSLARCLVDECHIDRLLDDIASRFTSAPASTRTAQLFLLCVAYQWPMSLPDPSTTYAITPDHTRIMEALLNIQTHFFNPITLELLVHLSWRSSSTSIHANNTMLIDMLAKQLVTCIQNESTRSDLLSIDMLNWLHHFLSSMTSSESSVWPQPQPLLTPTHLSEEMIYAMRSAILQRYTLLLTSSNSYQDRYFHTLLVECDQSSQTLESNIESVAGQLSKLCTELIQSLAINNSDSNDIRTTQSSILYYVFILVSQIATLVVDTPSAKELFFTHQLNSDMELLIATLQSSLLAVETPLSIPILLLLDQAVVLDQRLPYLLDPLASQVKDYEKAHRQCLVWRQWYAQPLLHQLVERLLAILQDKSRPSLRGHSSSVVMVASANVDTAGHSTNNNDNAADDSTGMDFDDSHHSRSSNMIMNMNNNNTMVLEEFGDHDTIHLWTRLEHVHANRILADFFGLPISTTSTSAVTSAGSTLISDVELLPIRQAITSNILADLFIILAELDEPSLFWPRLLEHLTQYDTRHLLEHPFISLDDVSIIGQLLPSYQTLLESRQTEKDRDALITVLRGFTGVLRLVQRNNRAITLTDTMLEQIKVVVGWFDKLNGKQVLPWRVRIEYYRLVARLWSIDDSDSEAAISALFVSLLGSIEDPEFTIRIEAANLLATLWQEQPARVMSSGGLDAILHRLNTLDQNIPASLSRIWTLVQLSSLNQGRLGNITLPELFKYPVPSTSWIMVGLQKLLDIAASVMGYSTREQLMWAYRRPIIVTAINEGRLWQLPIRLFEYETMEKFCEKLQVVLASCLVASMTIDSTDDTPAMRQLIELAQHLQIQLDALLTNHYAAIIAATLPMYFTERRNDANYIVKQFLRQRLGANRFDRLMSQQISGVLGQLFALTANPHRVDLLERLTSQEMTRDRLTRILAEHNEVTPSINIYTASTLYYSVENILQAVEYLAHMFNEQAIDVFLKPLRVTFILHSLFESIEKIHGTDEQRRLFDIICLIIAMSNMEEDYLLRMLMYRSIRLLTLKSTLHLVGAIGQLLRYLGELTITCAVISTRVHTTTAIFLIEQIIPEMISMAMSNSSTTSVHTSPLWQTSRHLTKFALESTMETTSIPIKQSMDRISALVDWMERVIMQSSDVTPTATEAILLYRSPYLKLQGPLQRLYIKGLQHHMSDYLSFDAATEPLAFLIDSLEKTTDPEARTDLLRCIGKLGVYSYREQQKTLGVKSSSSSSNTRATSTSVNKKTNSVVGQARCFGTKVVAQLLFDDDITVSGLATRTLMRILATEEGGEAFRGLDEETQRILLIFCSEYQPLSESIPTVALNDQVWQYKDSFNAWISAATRAVIDALGDPVLRHIAALLVYQPQLGDEILPSMVHLLLYQHATREPECEHVQDICPRRHLSIACNRWLSLIADKYVVGSSMLEDEKKVTDAILAVIAHLRSQMKPTESTMFASNRWLDIDYFVAAKVALISDAPYTALMYTELARMLRQDTPQPMEQQQQQVDEECALLRTIYAKIDDSDSYHGLDISISLQSLTQRFELDHHWTASLLHNEAQLETVSMTSILSNTIPDETTNYLAVMRAMGHLGLHRQRLDYITSWTKNANISSSSNAVYQNTEAIDMQLESAWRHGQFDASINTMGRVSEQANLFRCLQSMQSYNVSGSGQFEQSIKETLEYIGQQLIATNMHHIAIVPKLRYLQSLIELEEMMAYLRQQTDSIDDITQQWNNRLTTMLTVNRFDSVEQVVAVRSTALLLALNQLTNGAIDFNKVEHYLYQHLLKISGLARKNHQVHLAQNALQQAKTVAACSPNLSFNQLSLAIEEAKLLWKQGERTLAMRQTEKLLADNHVQVVHQATLLRLLGKWKTKEQMEHPEKIIRRYFEPAGAHSDQLAPKDLGKAEYLLAIYADQQLQHITDAPELQQLRMMHAQKQAEVRACDTMLANATSDKEKANLLRHRRRVDIQAHQDQEEIEREHARQQLLLEKSLENYLRSLKLCCRYDLSVFRVMSLWFKHNDNHGALSVTARWLPQVPSYKFIPLVYQLSARMEDIPGRFPEQLRSLVRRMTRKHPFHTLYQIIALRNSVTNLSSSHADKSGTQSRATVARVILKQLKNDPKMSEIVKSMEILADAYMEIALSPVARDKLTPNAVKDGIPFERKLSLPRLEAMPSVPIMTHDLAIEATGNYSNFVSISGFGHRFRVAGGINLPRIIECQGSDGRWYTQLVKGNDDLRQDAVLEQVFGIVNQLLLKNVATRERRLKLRTYKVVPLSPRAGVLQWVNDTCPLGDYLSRAHKIYRPKDWTATHCRQLMSEEHSKAESTLASKLQVYVNIQAHFKPVFRYFFIDQYQDTQLWFERRNSYTKSVAVSSMVGYVLGIGDRHAQNILIDRTTAEVVHIDLGIAFDQGKLLPTPERVPFRLTRDMVDGMGIAGVEGVFRKGCEEVLRVLRENSGDLLAILDVFRYDPLYSWEISPLKVIHLQEGDTVPMHRENNPDNTPVLPSVRFNAKPVNTEAERALATVQAKLARTVDVSCKVNDLIREATNEENLCRIFPGWQPWF